MTDDRQVLSGMATELKKMVDSNGSFSSSDDLIRSETSDQPLIKREPSICTMSENLDMMEKKYGAFMRNDAYGLMGRGELRIADRIMLGFALITLVPIRLVMAIVILLIYYLICRFCTIFSTPNRENGQEDYAHMIGWRREVVVRSGRFLSRAMLFNFGFYKIKMSRFQDEGSEQPVESKRAGVIVSNHVSYLDILYHMSSSFPSFAAKRSVEKLPFVGIISKCLGCVYVQRESKSSDFKGVSAIITERIQEAHKSIHAPMMLLFPEGTTTNGDYLLPFKTGAFLAKVPVYPIILRYPYKRFSPAWDSISGARHVILLLCQFVNHIEATGLPVYYPSDQDKEDPKLYASNVRKVMGSKGNLILSEVGLAEKRVYHAALNGNSLPRVLHVKDD